jgi:hypothetical protein
MDNRRIYWSRFNGVPLPDGAVRIDRGTRYGNPYPVATYGREEAMELYRVYLAWVLKWRMLDLRPIIGHNLACSCKPGEPCHGDILLEKIEELYKGYNG